MNTLPEAVEDIVYVYEHNLRFLHVMNELKDKFCLKCKSHHNIIKCNTCSHSFCRRCQSQYKCRHCDLDYAIFDLLLFFDVIKEDDKDTIIERINQIFVDDPYGDKEGLMVLLAMWEVTDDLTYEQIFDYIYWYKTFLDECEE